MVLELASKSTGVRVKIMGDSRKAFEAYASNNGQWPGSIERDRDGQYRLMQTHGAWTVWQAATDSLQSQLDAERERNAKLVRRACVLEDQLDDANAHAAELYPELEAVRAQCGRALGFIVNAMDGEPTDNNGRDNNGLAPVRYPDWLDAAYWRGQIGLARETLESATLRQQAKEEGE